MAYNPNIPQANNLLSQSQADILNNFTSIGTLLDPNNGAVTFPQQVADETTNGTTVALYSKTAGGNTQLFFRPVSNGTPINLTGSLKSQNGWAYLPSGILLQWGNTIGGTTQAFPITFPTACYNIQVSLAAGSGTKNYITADVVANLNGASFTTFTYDANKNPSSPALFYFAIGA